MSSVNNEIYAVGIMQWFAIHNTLYCFGTLDDILEFLKYHCEDSLPCEWRNAYLEYLNGNKKASYNSLRCEQQLIVPCKVYFKKIFKGKNHCWKHITEWRQSVFYKAEEYNNEHIWIEVDGVYYRCIKPVFTDLYVSDEYDYSDAKEVDYDEGFLLTDFIKNDRRIITSRLFIFEKSFGSSYEKMKEDYMKFEEKYAEYTALCDIIYGYGGFSVI